MVFNKFALFFSDEKLKLFSFHRVLRDKSRKKDQLSYAITMFVKEICFQTRKDQKESEKNKGELKMRVII